MKGITQYIIEKLKITKDNIDPSDNTYLLDVKIKDIEHLRNILIDYLLSVYGDKDFNAGDINKFGSTQWNLRKNLRGFIETIGVSNQFVIDVNVSSDESRGFSIQCGTVKEFPNEVVFKYFYNDQSVKSNDVKSEHKKNTPTISFILEVSQFSNPCISFNLLHPLNK